MQGQLTSFIISTIEIVLQPKAMMYKLVLMGMLTTSLAIPAKQVNLEDIENENLNNENRLKTHMQQMAVLKLMKSPPPLMQYGFRPMKLQEQTEYDPRQQQQQQFYILPQQYVPKYFAYPTNPQPEPQYQQQPLFYITNNHLPQQFYTPQYLYLGHDASVNPKLSLTYVRPQHVLPVNNIENVQQTSPTYQIQYFAIPQPQQEQKVQYKYEQIPNQKVAPKSLLDSYVPSYLQLQHIHQTRENAIKHASKIPLQIKGGLGRNLVYRNVLVNHH